MEGLTSMSLLFIYRKSEKSTQIWQYRTKRYLMVSGESGQASAHILPEAGQTFWATLAVRSWCWPHKQEFWCWSRLQPQHFKEKPEGPVSLNLELMTQEMYLLSQQMILPSQISSIFPTAGLESSAGKQKKAHPPKNAARNVFLYLSRLQVFIWVQFETPFLSILSLKIKLYLRGLKTE